MGAGWPGRWMEATLVSSATGLPSASRLRAGGGQRAGEGEAAEGAVDAAARVDALDDLLAEVAALGEVQGAGLAADGRGLLREVFVADVGAERGVPSRMRRCSRAAGVDFERSGIAKFMGDQIEGGGIRPDLELRDERTVGVDEIDGGCAPV